MAGSTARLSIEVVGDAADAQRALEGTASSAGKFDSAMRKAAVPAGIVAGGLLAIGKASADAASDLEQSSGAIEKVFGSSNAAKVAAWGRDAAKNMGLSTAAYEQFAAVSGAMLQNLGFDSDSAAAKSNQLIQTGADLAATFGTDTATAVDALGASLRGEYDSLEQFGIKLSAAGVAAQVAADGNSGLTGQALQAAQAQATLELITQGASSSLGAYAAEADTAAGAQQTANAQWENAKASLGDVLTPIIAGASAKLAELFAWVEQNKASVQTWLVVIGIAAAAILAYNLAVSLAAVATGIFSAAVAVGRGVLSLAAGAVWLFNAALYANPIVLVIGLVVALLAVIFIFRDQIAAAAGKVREFFDAFLGGGAVLGPIGGALRGLSTLIGGIAAAAQFAASQVQSLVDALSALTTTKVAGTAVIAPRAAVPGALGALAGAAPLALSGPAAGPPAFTPAASSLLPALSGAAGALGPVTVINVTGALDPDAVARQIDSILRARGRRAGPVIL